VSSRQNGIGFFKGFLEIILDGSGHFGWKDKTVIRVNQLSKQKYIHISMLTRA
jgi:phage tail tape-measure protein